jgi:hypothetical protein
LLDGLGVDIKISVYVFGDRVKRLCAPTNDLAKIKQAFDLVYKMKLGGTRIYESIMETARLASTGSATDVTRLMLIMSDGFATTNTPPRNAAQIANAYGISLYPMVLGHDKIVKQLQAENRNNRNDQPRHSRAADKEMEIQEFAMLGELTGGRSFDPPVASSLMMRSMLRFMAGQIVCQYVAGYNPGPPGAEPQKHKITVRLRNKSLGKLVGGTRLVTH